MVERQKNKKNKKSSHNPDDLSKSFDVYINKNPSDTIPIKYTTVKDVKDTINKLEKLYKAKVSTQENMASSYDNESEA